MKSNAYDVACNFIKAHKNGQPYRGIHRAGNFTANGNYVRSYDEVIAFFYGGKFYTTTQKFSATTSCHENTFRQAALGLVEPARLVVVPDINEAYELASADGMALVL